MKKLTWYAKQIVPMTYRTEVGRDGAQHFDDRVLAS